MMEVEAKQGTPEWRLARKGRITGSKFSTARERLKSGKPSAECMSYAMDVARERCGGTAPDKYQNQAMRFGTEQEPLCRQQYEIQTGNVVQEVGFFADEEGFFGLSPDGLIGDDGVLEIKTMVSSNTLFSAVAQKNTAPYLDQVNGYLWLLGRQWVDLVLWSPDLEELGLQMVIHRIWRNEEVIASLEQDLMEFAKLVTSLENQLKDVALELKTNQQPEETFL